MDRGAHQAIVHGVAESDRTEVTQHACMAQQVWSYISGWGIK